MGGSNTIPLSTVLQLVGNSIIGVLFLGNWSGTQALLIGFAALAIVVVGALLTSVSDDNGSGQKVTTANFLFLLVTTIGYWVYSTFPSLPVVKGEDSVGIFLPEMLGILIGASIYGTIATKGQFWKESESYKNILGGLSWGAAAFAYIFAARQLGTNTAFIFTQLNVIIATFGGILILHERKSAKEMKFTVSGIVLIVLGSILTIFA